MFHLISEEAVGGRIMRTGKMVSIAGWNKTTRRAWLWGCVVMLSAGRGLAQIPSVSPGGVVNGASFAVGAPVAPGSIISIFGSNLANGTVTASSVPLPAILGGTSVLINGRLAPLFYASPGQVNAQLPFETATGAASVVVTVGSVSSAPVSFNVALSAPGLFVLAGNRGLVFNQDGTLNSSNNAAPSGSVITAYLTGQGPVDNPVATGAAAPASPLSNATAPASANIGGQNAVIQFLGLAPGFVGLLQANIRLPNLPSGDYPLVITIGGAASNPGLVTVSGSGQVQPTVGPANVRTLVYHQITSFPSGAGVNMLNGDAPVISRNGNVAAYAVSNRIFAINTDGTTQRQVDAYTAQCYCDSKVDINSDGTTIIATEGVQLRVAGSGTILNTTGSIGAIRVTDDGSKIFFVLTNDSSISGTSTRLERGLYSIGANGNGLRQLVSPEAVVPLLGGSASADSIFFAGGGHLLDISGNGAHIVFPASTTPNGAPSVMLGVNGDGSGLHPFPLGATYAITAVALSDNGAVAAYVRSPSPCCSNPFELVAINFDGSGRAVLSSNVPGINGDPLVIDTAGKWLHWEGVLYSTDGSTRFQLDGSHAPFWGPLDAVSLVTMNGTATRFLYVWGGGQLATIDLNPALLGSAPSITNPTLNPDYILPHDLSTATVTASVTPSGKLNDVEANTFRNGLYDSENTNGGVMVDDGTNGDVKAGDGIYTFNGIYSDGSPPDPIFGPIVVRIYADVTGSDNRRHATSIDVAPFFLVATTPVGAPQLNAVNPLSGAPGTQVTISGSGFDGIAANNVVIFGNRLATVVGASTTQLIVVVPLDMTTGSVPLTVAAQGAIANVMSFTVAAR